ncbi:uncharacterized protein LOC117333864 [Pecten maximus]|uniref:uncharacterized protein LOC117333864 n=1 Tax=Pecten maximus TaxID=6579 RepID=UPI00145906FC|nr:uncharacterized protein LOC117333864 [Pecten maximus]
MQPNLCVCSYVAAVVVIMSSVAYCYPRKHLSQDTQPDAAYFYEDVYDKRGPLEDPVLYMSPRTYQPLEHFIKRGYQSKRYSLNDLIARLRAMVGSDEIRHSGRSSYLRFGAGGKR